MSDRVSVFSHHNHDHDPQSTTTTTPLKMLRESINTLLRNKQTFASIFALTTLPLSFLLFSLSLSSHPLKSHIYNLESLASLAPTRFEARQVWKESRDDAVSLFRIKLLFFLPSLVISLIAAVTAVTATSLSFNGKPVSLRNSLAAVKLSWKRTLATSICIYALSIAYAIIPRTLALVFSSPGSRFFILVVGSGVEIYVMAVMGLGLVASILEERYGVDAIRAGSDLMAGKRLCGWALSGLFVVVTWVIARKLEQVMDGQDLMEKSSTAALTRVVMGIGEKLGWVILYGFVVLWGYVVTSVFYCECRKRHVISNGGNEAV